MTTRLAAVKRLRATLILFAVALIAAGAVYYVVTEVIKRTDERVNGIVCVTRPFIQQGRDRSLAAENDPKLSPESRARARQARIDADQFLSGLVLEPRNYDCKPLLKRLLEEQERRDKEARPGNP